MCGLGRFAWLLAAALVAGWPGSALAAGGGANLGIIALEALAVGAFLGGGIVAPVAYVMARRRQHSLAQRLAEAERSAEAAHAEAAQARAAERAMFENAMVGLFRTTAEGWLLKGNDAVARLHGYDSFEAMTADDGNYIPDYYVEPAERDRLVQRLYDEDVVRGFEARIRRRDGEIIWISVDIRVAYAPDGEVTHFEGAVSDISDRKAMEVALREAKEQADFASRTKSEFLANTSHELRTPLNAIIGFAEIIKNEMFGAIQPQEYVDYARDIHDSGRHLLSLINDILDMSKVEAGRRELEPSRINIERLVQEAMRLVHARADQAGLRISVDIPEDQPGIWAEERALKQVLVNLLSNAVKFTDHGGTVTVGARLNEVGDFILSVADTGIGMNDTDIQTALIPFGQVDSALNRQHPGTGLGLPLVRSLVDLHGGTLDIQSTPGEGSTFIVRLPAERVIDSQAA